MFEPKDINFNTKYLSVSDIVKYINENNIKLNYHKDNPRQINTYSSITTWNDNTKSKFIESLLLDLPLSPIYLDLYQTDNYYIIDGNQRLLTIYDFINDKFNLINMLYIKEYENLSFSKLNVVTKRQLLETQLLFNILYSPIISQQSLHEIYKRFNNKIT